MVSNFYKGSSYRMKFKAILLFIISVLLSTGSKANHGIGAEITYRALDTFEFEVTYIFYRECGTSFSSTVPATCYVSCASTNRLQVFPTLTEVKNVIPYHDTIATGCPTSYVAGSTFGLEKLVFKDTVNFNGTAYSALKNCCNITFEAVSFPRTPSHNTGLATQLMYNYSYLNLCQSNDNSSAELSFDELSYLCCNQAAYMSFSSLDTMDDDSLSYSWDQPLRGYGNSVNYTGSSNYAYNHPFQAYYPGSLSPPYSNPTASPPIGIYLNPRNGDLVLTPTRCSEITAAVVRITEWRKDTSGNYQQIGFTRVERMYVTMSCPGNNSPEIIGQTDYNACVGTELCFKIRTADAIFTPPPPAVPSAGDTTSISWNHAISDASFTILSDTFREKTAEFCWTPNSNDLRSRPYYFTTQVRDNNSPINALSYKSFSIRVNGAWDATIVADSLACSWYALTVDYDSANHQNTDFLWDVLDSAGNKLFDKFEFASNGSYFSETKYDSIKFKYSGTYIVRLLLSDSNACNKYVYDTIQITNPSRIDLSLGNLSVCKGYTNIISSSTNFGTGPYMYQWYVNDTLSINDTLSNYYVSIDSANQLFLFTVVATDANGCQERANSNINSFAENFPNFPDTITSCLDSIRLEVSSQYLAINWSTGSQDSAISISISDLYSIGILDTNSCEYQDYFYVFLVPEPSSEISDTFLCHGSTLTLDAGNYVEYDWSTGSTSRSINISDSGSFSVALMDQYGCSGLDSFRVQVKQLPNLQLRDSFVCYSDAELSINSAIILSPQNVENHELEFSCIECNENEITDIIEDRGVNDFYLILDASTYTMKNALVDSLILTLEISDSNGCRANEQTEILIYADPEAPSLTRNGSVITSSYPNVKWYRNDSLLDDRTSDTLITSTLGTYTARAYSHENCALSELSNSIEVTLGIDDLYQMGWRLYPNPSHGNLRIEAPFALTEELSLKIYNELGQEIKTEWVQTTSSIAIRFDAPPGVYVLQISLGSKIYFERILNQ